jgi:hypothetical protein
VCATFPRQALHAWRLACAHPVTGAPLTITAPLPADVQALVDAAGVGAALAAATAHVGPAPPCGAATSASPGAATVGR